MNIHFLGTGSAEPDPRRNNTSLLLEFDDRLVLIDCSGSPGHTIQAAGFALETLSDVILTHAHADHVYAIPSLVHGLWLHGGVRPGKRLTIHAPETVAAVAHQLLDVFTLTTRKDAVELTWKKLASDRAGDVDVRLGSWHLEYFPVTHTGIDAIGLTWYIDKDRAIVYSADAIVDDLLSQRVRDTTRVLIQDCGGGLHDTSGHAGAEGVARMISGLDIETLLLVHLPPNHENVRAATIDVLSEAFTGELRIPDDGDVFRVTD